MVNWLVEKQVFAPSVKAAEVSNELGMGMAATAARRLTLGAVGCSIDREQSVHSEIDTGGLFSRGVFQAPAPPFPSFIEQVR